MPKIKLLIERSEWRLEWIKITWCGFQHVRMISPSTQLTQVWTIRWWQSIEIFSVSGTWTLSLHLFELWTGENDTFKFIPAGGELVVARWESSGKSRQSCYTVLLHFAKRAFNCSASFAVTSGILPSRNFLNILTSLVILTRLILYVVSTACNRGVKLFTKWLLIQQCH